MTCSYLTDSVLKPNSTCSFKSANPFQFDGWLRGKSTCDFDLLDHFASFTCRILCSIPTRSIHNSLNGYFNTSTGCALCRKGPFHYFFTKYSDHFNRYADRAPVITQLVERRLRSSMTHCVFGNAFISSLTGYFHSSAGCPLFPFHYFFHEIFWSLWQVSPNADRAHSLLTDWIFWSLQQVAPNANRAPVLTKLIERRLRSSMTHCVFGNAFISVMAPGTRIEPHFGPCNVRLRCHLGKCNPALTKTPFDLCWPHMSEC